MGREIAVLLGALFALAPLSTQAQTPPQSPAPAATPGETAHLDVPAGWVEKPFNMSFGNSTVGHMWFSTDPSVAGDNLNIAYSDNPAGLDLKAVVSQNEAFLGKLVGPDNLTESHAEKLCNGTTDGWYLSSRMTMGSMSMVQEVVFFVGKTRVFTATYTRMKSHVEDPALRKALDTLCANPLV